MKIYSANEIRNIAVMGHSGCGKTTLMESVLNLAGVSTRIGRVEDGNTMSDYDPEEIRRGVSISASVLPVEWQSGKINFIDTPGYFDFAGEVVQAVAGADTAMIILSAKSGVEVGTEKAWEHATNAKLPKMFVINGMDDENADFDKAVDQLTSMFGTSVAPLCVPIRENGKFTGFVNVISKKGYTFNGKDMAECDVPASLSDSVDNIYTMLTEAVAETDEELLDKYLSEGELSAEELEAGIKNGVEQGMVTPVFCCSAPTQLGVKALLDAIVSYIPTSAVLSKTVTAKNNKGEDVTVKCEESESPVAFVFKTISDPFVGKLSIFRVYSGVLRKDGSLFNTRSEATERLAKLFVIRGKEQIEVSELKAGDIGAMSKLTATATQDTLCAKENQVSIAPINYPEAYLTMAISLKGKGGEDKMAVAMQKLLEEDKTLKFGINQDTRQTIITGTGDNQLDVVVNKLKNAYKIEVELNTPLVSYREMIKGKVSSLGSFKKQSGGSGQFGVVTIEFEPLFDNSKDYEFEEKIFGGAVPKQYFPAVEKGIQECVKAGPLAAYPVVGIKCTLVDGKYHAVDSSELAFKMAAILSFKEGFMKAKPALLEPIMHVEVFVPDDYTGDIMGDMNKRRGKILGMEKLGALQKIVAEAPHAEMLKYATELRSMTQGRGYFTMDFEKFEEAPADVQQKVIDIRKAEVEKNNE
jgi:elongation factor G